MTQLLGPTAIGVPRPVNPVPFAQKDIHGEPAARWGADILAERAIGSRVPSHPIAHPPLVGKRFVDRSLRDDDEPGVIAVQELQPGELGGEAGAARTLPLLTGEPHVVVDNELLFTVEYVGQLHRSVLGFQYIVWHLDHRQPSSLRGDRVQVAGGRLFPDAQCIQFALPGLLVYDGRQSYGCHDNPPLYDVHAVNMVMFTPYTLVPRRVKG